MCSPSASEINAVTTNVTSSVRAARIRSERLPRSFFALADTALVYTTDFVSGNTAHLAAYVPGGAKNGRIDRFLRLRAWSTGAESPWRRSFSFHPSRRRAPLSSMGPERRQLLVGSVTWRHS